MWSCERSIDTPAPASAVWKQYEDVAGWPAWNPGFESVRLGGPFLPGTNGSVVITTVPVPEPGALALAGLAAAAWGWRRRRISRR